MSSLDDVTIEITPHVLLKAYSCGIFPMAESADNNALYWIEPERRGILPLDAVHIPRSLAKTIRRGGFEIKIDNDFDADGSNDEDEDDDRPRKKRRRRRGGQRS